MGVEEVVQTLNCGGGQECSLLAKQYTLQYSRPAAVA